MIHQYYNNYKNKITIINNWEGFENKIIGIGLVLEMGMIEQPYKEETLPRRAGYSNFSEIITDIISLQGKNPPINTKLHSLFSPQIKYDLHHLKGGYYNLMYNPMNRIYPGSGNLRGN